MASIYLIRHGQASFGQANYDQLSDLGEQQAAHLGRSLKARFGQFDQVYLGSMARHKQTAEACLDSMGQESTDFQVNPGWNEYDHENILACFDPAFTTPDGIESFVRQQQNPKKAFETLFNNAMNRWMSGDFDSDYTESWQHFQQRVRDALAHAAENASKDTSAKKIAVFTSGGPITLLSQYLLGVDAERIMQLNWTLLNCGVSKIVTTGSRMFLASLNEHPHFEGDHSHLISYK